MSLAFFVHMNFTVISSKDNPSSSALDMDGPLLTRFLLCFLPMTGLVVTWANRELEMLTVKPFLQAASKNLDRGQITA